MIKYYRNIRKLNYNCMTIKYFRKIQISLDVKYIVQTDDKSFFTWNIFLIFLTNCLPVPPEHLDLQLFISHLWLTPCGVFLTCYHWLHLRSIEKDLPVTCRCDYLDYSKITWTEMQLVIKMTNVCSCIYQYSSI